MSSARAGVARRRDCSSRTNRRREARMGDGWAGTCSFRMSGIAFSTSPRSPSLFANPPTYQSKITTRINQNDNKIESSLTDCKRICDVPYWWAILNDVAS
jgi:hypothetical protein